MSKKEPNNKDILERIYENASRIGIVQSEIKDIKSDLSEIKNNHLHGIYRKLDRITWWLVALLGGVVVQLIIYFITKM
jgi:hypothetical protein